MYEALIGDDLAWDPQAPKFKAPQDLVFSTLRALDIQPREPQEALRSFEFLGQRQYTPGSPAGWPDTAQSWDGSDALLHRVLWAARMGERFDKGTDPVAMCRESLGTFARPDTLTALQRAASGSQALALSQNIPLILRGAQAVLSKSAQVTPEMDEDLMARLADLDSKDDWFTARLSEAVQSEKLGQVVETAAPVANADNPKRQVNARIQKSAQMAAAIMAADGGPEIAVLEASGWDTHANQGGAQGTLANRLSGLDQSLRAFAGGRVMTQWPGLAPTDLYQGRDLMPTQDLRGIYKAVLADHLAIDQGRLQRTVFPDSGTIKPLSGLIKS